MKKFRVEVLKPAIVEVWAQGAREAWGKAMWLPGVQQVLGVLREEDGDGEAIRQGKRVATKSYVKWSGPKFQNENENDKSSDS
jgi:hypothetical protein